MKLQEKNHPLAKKYNERQHNLPLVQLSKSILEHHRTHYHHHHHHHHHHRLSFAQLFSTTLETSHLEVFLQLAHGQQLQATLAVPFQ